MEGLQIAAILAKLPPTPLPTRGWAFPGPGTAVLRLPTGDLAIHYQPPEPSLSLGRKVEGGAPITPIQRALQSHARGRLMRIEQHKLDRVVFLDFEGEKGFVEAPPVRVIVELTGRNANLILTSREGKIIAIDRPVTKKHNRYRELLPGHAYTPPPPYEKLDPRRITAEALRPLVGQPLKKIIGLVDGLGPRLTRRLAGLAGIPIEQTVDEASLPKLVEALGELVLDPFHADEEASVTRAFSEEAAEALRRPLLAALEKERRTLEKRRQDHLENLAQEREAARLKHLGELILAYAHQIPPQSREVMLDDYAEGKTVKVELDPKKTPVENAQAYFAKAKKKVAAAKRAKTLLKVTEENLKRIEAEIEALREAPPNVLRKRLKAFRQQPPVIGARHRAPGGFEVLVGRNARENEALLRLARPDDLWFHAQGIPGAHVILRTQGKSPPLESLIFAARLAAYHSRARGEQNAPVDYTRRKYVHKVKKAPPGTVTYTQAKTLFVSATLPQAPETV